MLTGQSPSHLKSRPSPASSGTICPGTVGRPDVAKVLKGGASMPPGMKAPGTHNPASVPFAAWDNKEWVLQDGGPGPAPSPGLHGEVSPCLARKTPPQGQPSLLTSLLLPALPWGGGPPRGRTHLICSHRQGKSLPQTLKAKRGLVFVPCHTGAPFSLALPPSLHLV